MECNIVYLSGGIHDNVIINYKKWEIIKFAEHMVN